MEIAEVQDRESLERYLEELPEEERREVSARVSFRAAARVLPIIVLKLATSKSLVDDGLSAAPIFGCALVAAVANNYLTADLQISAETVSHFSTAASSSSLVNFPVNAAHSSAHASVVSSAYYARKTTNGVATTVSLASHAAMLVNGYQDAIWEGVRADLLGVEASEIWYNAPPHGISNAWHDAKVALQADARVNWSFWIAWYERVLEGRDFLPDAIVPILNGLREDDWEKGPAHINPLFDGIVAQYRELDLALSAGDLKRPTAIRNIKAIRSQVSTLQDYLEAEYGHLSGHNARNLEQDDMLEVLKELKALVEAMMECLEASDDDNQALVIVREQLPAVVAAAGELAIVETEPQVSATIVTMSASIKMLVDAGADQKLATQIAMSDAATKKVMPFFQRYFPWGKKQ